MITGGNILYEKAQELFFLVFMVEFRLHFIGFLKVYVTLLLLRKYLTLKIEKDVLHGFFFTNYEPPNLGKKLLQPKMSLSQKYI